MRLAIFLMVAAAVRAKELTPEVQAQLQDTLRQFIVAFNGGDREVALRYVHPEFVFLRTGMGFPLSESLNNLQKGKPPFEVAVLTREVRMMTDDVAVGEGFFRTIGLPRGDRAGGVNVMWLRTGQAWKIATLGFEPIANEGPVLNIEPAVRHDPAGPDGWVSLLDEGGSRLVGVSGSATLASWKLTEGVLAAEPSAPRQSVRTRDMYRSFELQFEWKVPPKGNSGLKYRMYFLFVYGPGSDGAGAEYQVADDAGDAGAIQHAVERSGALYNQIAPREAVLRPVGEFNESRIVVRGRHCEHWLNGVKVVEYEAESAPLESPLLFQHHGTGVWYRNVKVRRLD